MSIVDRQSMDTVPRVRGAGDHPGRDGAWDVLERFGLALQQCGPEREPVRLLVAAVQEALEADAVYCHPSETAGAVEQSGPVCLEGDWCRRCTERLAAEAADGQGVLWRSFLDPAARPLSPWPWSAALVCLGRSGGAWLAALSFHPRRLFAASDVAVMRLARRMLLNHRLYALRYRNWKESLDSLGAALDALLADGRQTPRLDGDVLEHFRDCRRRLDTLRQHGGIG